MKERAIRNWEWLLVIVLLLLTWGLRLCCLEEVPPGWRDDELINIHTLSGELLRGRFPLYFTGASGHEPLYHYLHAGVHAVLGFNVLSGHFLSIALGTLTVALTYTLARRLFGRITAALASLGLASSFWSLMYSRTAIRHISLLPLALAAFYLLWRSLTSKPQISHHSSAIGRSILLGLLLGVSLYTYPAARLLPLLLVLFAVYMAFVHRDRFRRHWRVLVLALAVMAVLAAPLAVAIARGRSEAAAQGIGADARLAELAVPLRELCAGNPRPLLRSIWLTLRMFHATGDPEWLYNVSGRPVFNLLGGVLLWTGVALCLVRWREPRYSLLLLWLGLGLLPAFVSTPPASLSHTILAQAVVYILPALALTEFYHWLRSGLPLFGTRPSSFVLRRLFLIIGYLSFVIFLVTNAARDLRAYFLVWPQQDMTRILYRADYREAADYLNAHPRITDVAISSALFGPWDRLALDVDIRRDDVAVRLFNPERALVWTAEEAPSIALLTSWPGPTSPIEGFLNADTRPPEPVSNRLTLHALPAIHDSQFAVCNPQSAICSSRFANGLTLIEAHWLDGDALAPDQEATLFTTWHVSAPLDLPPMPIVANPPPPGVYSGPRLSVFTHLLSVDGTLVTGDDGLWVDPLTLQPGDWFVQIHRFAISDDAPVGPYALELGLYDPKTGERWAVLDTEGQPYTDRVVFQ